MKFHTWQITVSTAEDLEKDASDGIVDYIRKKSRYGYVVLEHASATLRLHMHICVCFKQPIASKHINETLWSHVAPRHPTAIKTVALKTTVQYNMKWYDDYLLKDPDRTVLFEKMSGDYINYFPTQEEQQALIAAKAAKRPISNDSKDPWFSRHEVAWEEMYPSDASYQSAVRYLNYCMNTARSMPVIKDRRRFCETAWALHRYRTHAIEPTTYDLNFEHQQTGGGHNYAP